MKLSVKRTERLVIKRLSNKKEYSKKWLRKKLFKRR